MRSLGENKETLGPVPQSRIKLTLDKWKILIAISLPLKKGLQQNCDPERL